MLSAEDLLSLLARYQKRPDHDAVVQRAVEAMQAAGRGSDVARIRDEIARYLSSEIPQMDGSAGAVNRQGPLSEAVPVLYARELAVSAEGLIDAADYAYLRRGA